MPYPVTCAWCAKRFGARQYDAQFCGDPCRSAFNNQRAKRGAILYDLLMLARHDAAAIERYRLDDRLQEALSAFDDADLTAGRKRTWKRAQDVHIDTLAFAKR